MPENLREVIRRLQDHLQKLRDGDATQARINAIEKMIADLQEELIDNLPIAPPPPDK